MCTHYLCHIQHLPLSLSLVPSQPSPKAGLVPPSYILILYKEKEKR
jgi:hypothetical protein